MLKTVEYLQISLATKTITKEGQLGKSSDKQPMMLSKLRCKSQHARPTANKNS